MDHVVVDVLGQREMLLYLVELAEVDRRDRIFLAVYDALRQRQMPSLDQFRNDVATVTESAKSFREKTADLIDALLAHSTTTPVKTIPLPEAKYAAATALLGGLLIGLALGKYVL